MLKPPRPADLTDHGRDLLRNLAAGGASSLLKAVLQLAMLPIMGRLLGPREFGLYATVLPVVTFFTVIADGGLGSSLAKERSPDPTVWTTAFYVMLAVGVGVAGIVNLCGLGLAAFMGEPRLVGIMALLSLSFLCIAVSTLPSARLFQRNDLVSLSAVETVATFLGAGAAVIFAWKGYGAISLAIQTVAAFAVRAIGLNVLAFERPRGRFSLTTLAHHAGTGGVLVGTRLADMFCRFVENVLISKFFGPATLGSYTFANQVSRFLCESASNPIWSATYAQSLRLGDGRVGGLICDMARLLLLATFPIACLVVVSAPDVFPILLGAKWAHAGGFLQVLVLSYALSAAASVGSAALLAGGHNRAFFTLGASLSAARVLAVAVGFGLGPIGVAAMIAVANLGYAAAMVVIVSRTFGVAKSRLLGTTTSPALAGITGALACLVVLRALSRTDAGVFASLLIGGAALLAALIAFDKNFSAQNVRALIARGRAGGA